MPDSKPSEFERYYEIAKSAPELRYALCPLLEPGVEDHQHDIMSVEEIEKALWGMSNDENLLDLEHYLVDENVGRPVEKYILPADTVFVRKSTISPEAQDKIDQIAALQKSLAENHSEDVRLVRKGTAMLGAIWNVDAWESIKSGEKTGLSIFGTGTREDI